MKISQEEVRHIALLARLGIDEAEVKKFQIQLSNIMENFEILNQIDTTGLAPTSLSVSLSNVFREDKSKPSFTQDEVLENAPQRDENYFRIQAVLE